MVKHACPFWGDFGQACLLFNQRATYFFAGIAGIAGLAAAGLTAAGFTAAGFTAAGLAGAATGAPNRRIVTVFMVQNVLVPDSGKPRDVFQKIVMEAAGVTVPQAVVAKKAKP